MLTDELVNKPIVIITLLVVMLLLSNKRKLNGNDLKFATIIN